MFKVLGNQRIQPSRYINCRDAFCVVSGSILHVINNIKFTIVVQFVLKVLVVVENVLRCWRNGN